VSQSGSDSGRKQGKFSTFEEKAMVNAPSKPLSNLQLELLQLYGENVAEEDLKHIKRLIANYFAEKAVRSADMEWDEKGYSDELMDEWLKTDFRKLKSDARRP
jgi:hypothetical protein